MKEIIKLLRIRQWYKNVVVVLALFFSQNILNATLLPLTALAFLALCFLSSTNYIINDIIDRKKDALHPEKKTRPLASGKIKIFPASILALTTAAIAIVIILTLNRQTQILFVLFLLLSQCYNLFLKRKAFADILTIASLFVIRAIIGATAIGVVISPWLILCPFFLALYLATGKRHADLLLLEEYAQKTRPSLKEYSTKITTAFISMTTTLLVISYTLYSFLSEYNYLLWTLPFALYPIFLYTKEILHGSPIARHPEKGLKNKNLIISIIIWVIITSIALYLL